MAKAQRSAATKRSRKKESAESKKPKTSGRSNRREGPTPSKTRGTNRQLPKEARLTGRPLSSEKIHEGLSSFRLGFSPADIDRFVVAVREDLTKEAAACFNREARLARHWVIRFLADQRWVVDSMRRETEPVPQPPSRSQVREPAASDQTAAEPSCDASKSSLDSLFEKFAAAADHKLLSQQDGTANPNKNNRSKPTRRSQEEVLMAIHRAPEQDDGTKLMKDVWKLVTLVPITRTSARQALFDQKFIDGEIKTRVKRRKTIDGEQVSEQLYWETVWLTDRGSRLAWLLESRSKATTPEVTPASPTKSQQSQAASH